MSYIRRNVAALLKFVLTYNVKAASIAVFIHFLFSDLNVAVLEQAI